MTDKFTSNTEIHSHSSRSPHISLLSDSESSQPVQYKTHYHRAHDRGCHSDSMEVWMIQRQAKRIAVCASDSGSLRVFNMDQVVDKFFNVSTFAIGVGSMYGMRSEPLKPKCAIT